MVIASPRDFNLCLVSGRYRLDAAAPVWSGSSVTLFLSGAWGTGLLDASWRGLLRSRLAPSNPTVRPLSSWLAR